MTGSPERRLPINPTVADHREHIARTLVSWAMLISEERVMSTPTGNAPDETAPWLLVHLRWASAQLWIDDFALELAQLRGQALSLLFPSGRRRIEVGPCVEAGCPGVLTATVARTDDVLPSIVECDVEVSHCWEPHQWLALGRKVHLEAAAS